MNTTISFEVAKLLKEKGYKDYCVNFYTKPNSKMFGVDERDRPYPIKNTPKKLYRAGEHLVLHRKNIIAAPTISEVVMWLYKRHEIWISVICDVGNDLLFTFKIYSTKIGEEKCIVNGNMYNSPKESYLEAIKYVLTNLI